MLFSFAERDKWQRRGSIKNNRASVNAKTNDQPTANCVLTQYCSELIAPFSGCFHSIRLSLPLATHFSLSSPTPNNSFSLFSRRFLFLAFFPLFSIFSFRLFFFRFFVLFWYSDSTKAEKTREKKKHETWHKRNGLSRFSKWFWDKLNCMKFVWSKRVSRARPIELKRKKTELRV